jgi:DNA-binding IclR family transcriptional regulator
MESKTVTGTQSIDRACDLLVRILDSEEPQTLSELVVVTGLAKGTTSRILNALERAGLLARSQFGGFEPGPVLNQFAVRGGAYTALVNSVTPAMERIAAKTRETVSLAVIGHDGVDNIAQVEGDYILGSRNWVGESVPRHCSAAGKVLMAFAGASAPQVLEAKTSETITDSKVLDEHLRIVRERGYAVIRNELEPGLVAIAVPVFNEKGKAVAALSVTGPAERIAQENESRISSLMQRELSVNVRPQQEGAA